MKITQWRVISINNTKTTGYSHARNAGPLPYDVTLTQIIKLLEENSTGNLCDLELGKVFLDNTKSTSNKEKSDLIKIKNFCAKSTI